MITVYTLEDSEKWDKIVRSFKEFDTYWLSGYVKAFYLHGDGTPLLFFYEKDGTRGINVVMRRDIAKDSHFSEKLPEGKLYDLATPYGYGGWIIEGSDCESLFDSYQSWCEKNGIISEFVRFHPILKTHKYCSAFYEIVPLGEVVHINLDSPETIWDNFSSKNRNVIRKATRNGIKIYNGRQPEIYEKFHRIYDKTMDRDNAIRYYYFADDFYCSILDDLPLNAQVFFAVKDGITIASSIILAANGRMNYHLSGSVEDYRSLAPTNLLLYHAALWGNANGYKTLFLGGGVGSGEDSLFKFKRSFYKGELNRFHIGKKIFDQKKYDMLVSMRESSENSSFFPKYRA